MAISVNRLTIVGNVGAEPVRKGSGDGFVTMSVATSKTWKDRDTGERREKTQWHSVVIFNKAAANYAEQYIKKGDLVYIEGSLESREFQGSEGTVRLYELIVSPFEGVVQSMSRTNDGKRAQQDQYEERQRGEAQNRWEQNHDYGSGSGSGLSRDMDDDIPF